MKRRVQAILFSALLVVVMISATGCGNEEKEAIESGEEGATSSEEVVKIGMLWAKTGPGEVIDQVSQKACELAIEEINAAGGINGKQLEAITLDYAGDSDLVVEKTKELLLEEEVPVVLGITLGSVREAVVPVFEEYEGLLVYPTLFNGEEESEAVVYTGGTAYVQAKELLPWLMEEKGAKTFFLVGSDYSYPVALNAQAKAILAECGGEIVGEEYIPMESTDLASVINKIKTANPDVIYSSTVANTMISFYQQLSDYGIDTTQTTVASVITGEMDAINIGGAGIANTYSSFSWFQGFDNELSKALVENYAGKYGEEEAGLLSGTPVASYSSVKLLAEALKEADAKGELTPESVKEAMAGLSLETPQGKMTIDADNFYADTMVMITEWGEDAKSNIKYVSAEALPSEPWPALLYPNGSPE